jgi:hypothetical protein
VCSVAKNANQALSKATKVVWSIKVHMSILPHAGLMASKHSHLVCYNVQHVEQRLINTGTYSEYGAQNVFSSPQL